MSKDKKRKFSRRKFLTRTGIVMGGGAVLLYFGRHKLRSLIAEFVTTLDFPSGISDFSPSVWFEIAEDNRFILKSPKIEMGQGVFTGLAMMAAEELGVPLHQIQIVHSGTDGATDLTGTGGSTSTGSLFVPLRETAATLREMLLLAAAAKLGVNKEDVRITDGQIGHQQQQISLFELSQSQKEWKIPRKVKLRDRKDFTIIGKEVPRVDLVPKVMGQGIYGIDATMPNTLYASILRTPYLKATLKSADIREAKKSTGVQKIIQKDDWIAVVADKRYQAEVAKNKIVAEWEVSKKWQQEEIEQLVQIGSGSYVNIQKKGNITSLLADTNSNIFSQEYHTPFGVHAQMEPNGALANYQDDQLHIIMATQDSARVRAYVAKKLGIRKKNINIEVTYCGGGFGRRFFLNVAADAAYLSKEMSRPVHVFRDREEEFRNGYFRPFSRHQYRAVLDKDKKEIIGISHQQATGDMVLSHNLPKIGQKMLAADFIAAGHGAHIEYNIPHKMAKLWQVDLPVNTGIWRGVGCFTNGFARETFLDELAQELLIDPFELRLKHLDDQDVLQNRMRRVLETLRDESKWRQAKTEGIGRGMAIFVDRKTICAAVVDVQKIDGKIRITKLTHVTEPGIVVNPEGARTQVEGAIIMGISAAMYEKASVKDGKILQSNYHNYTLATLADSPEMNVILLEDEHAERPYGMGEPPIAPIAPAISNAIFDLTGERKRSLPFMGGAA